MFTVIVAILLLMVGTGQFIDEPQVKSACSEPLIFRVGEIDERFSITKKELVRLMDDAAKIWSDAVDETVIKYDEEGDISVNLVYAEEQQLSDRERQHRDRLEHEEFSITVLESEYQRLNREYEAEVDQYDEDSRELQQTIDRLNEWVRQKNEQGGFTEQDMQQFERRKAEIDRVKLELAQWERRLKQKAAELNEKITFLNEKVEAKNRLVDEYNRQFPGERKFTQGAYEWTNNSRTINIFHFLDQDELRLVLAHEMGHALGIGHVSNPESVMNELMESQDQRKLELTEEDIQALQTVCENQIN